MGRIVSDFQELRALLPATADFCEALTGAGFQVEASLDRSNPEFVKVGLKIDGKPDQLTTLIEAMHTVPTLPGVKMTIDWGEVQL